MSGVGREIVLVDLRREPAEADSATGIYWLLAGACVTVLPIICIGFFARAVWKMNFMDLNGMLAAA